jgi:monofunctional biosynthetic peptidoglycan transglycosylase
VDIQTNSELETRDSKPILRRIGLALAVLLAAAGTAFWLSLPDVTPLKTQWPRTTAFMEKRKAELRVSGGGDRLDWTPVPLSAMAPDLPRAVIAAEDSRFREHGGVDWSAVRAAVRKNYSKGNVKVGGSTITQQLAKNLFLSPSRTPWRKLKELAIARRLETSLGKDRILELYLNVIEFGRRTYGVEAASRLYFGKSARDLTREEAAILAAVIPSPRIYDPLRHRERVERRSRRILARMQGN